MSIKIKITATTEEERARVVKELKPLARRENLLLKLKKNTETGRYLAYIESRKRAIDFE